MYENLFEDSSGSGDEGTSERFYRPRIIFDYFSDSQIISYFRLSAGTIEMLVQRIGGQLASVYDNRATDLSPLHQIKIALNFYGTGDHFKTIAEANGVTAMSVSRVVERVTNAILSIGDEFLHFPTQAEFAEINSGFFQANGGRGRGIILLKINYDACQLYEPNSMPKVLGVLDGTLLFRQRPKNQPDFPFVSRKMSIAINAMVLVDHKLRFRVFNADKPGGCHDSYVLKLRWRQKSLSFIILGHLHFTILPKRVEWEEEISF